MGDSVALYAVALEDSHGWDVEFVWATTWEEARDRALAKREAEVFTGPPTWRCVREVKPESEAGFPLPEYTPLRDTPSYKSADRDLAAE